MFLHPFSNFIGLIPQKSRRVKYLVRFRINPTLLCKVKFKDKIHCAIPINWASLKIPIENQQLNTGQLSALVTLLQHLLCGQTEGDVRNGSEIVITH